MKSLIVLLVVAGVGCAAKEAAQPKADPITVRRQLSRALLGHQEWNAAIQPLRELVALRPNDAEAHAMLGTAYREQGLFAEAEQEYRAALKLDASRAEALAGLGVLAEIRGDAGDDAVTHLRRATELAPDEAAYHHNLGFALYVRGRYEEAEGAFREALRRNPSARRTRNNLGFTYAKLGDFHRARREFERGGSRAAAESNLGFAFEQAGRLDQACESYREALRLVPELPEGAENVKRVCARISASMSRDER